MDKLQSSRNTLLPTKVLQGRKGGRADGRGGRLAGRGSKRQPGASSAPNKGVQATAYSVRSYLAPASRRA